MSYFDELLKKREMQLPLWKLKVTDEEYENLRRYLEKETHAVGILPFGAWQKECALFFAEYWRREYREGAHSVRMVYDALHSTRIGKRFENEFYDAALKGAKRLKIEFLSGQNTQYLDTLLYQGGLPMQLVVQQGYNGAWDRFLRRLLNGKVNFDELNLGVVASQSKGLQEFCAQLYEAAHAGQYMKMPFWCRDENNSWYVYIQEILKDEKRRSRQLHPFSLTWRFDVDRIGKVITCKYLMKGLQKLPKTFIDEHNLSQNFFSVQLRVNGKPSGSPFEYNDNFCRYAVRISHHYHLGDTIALYLNDAEEPFQSKDIDMSIPHALFLNAEGRYELGNKVGKEQSLIIIPEGWNVENADGYKIETYSWADETYQGLLLDAGFEGIVTLTSVDGKICFGNDEPVYWTDLTSRPLYQPEIEETLYDARSAYFALATDDEDGSVKHVSGGDVEFRSKWDSHWTSQPAFGEIYARKQEKGGKFVAPIKLINVGEGLTISIVSAEKDSCAIRVLWAHGNVVCREGVKKANDTWEIHRQNCPDERKIHFVLSPTVNVNNAFTVSLKAPFRDFTIFDEKGNPIESDSWVPYSDVDKYQYHLIGQDVKEYSYGGHKRKLSWIGDKLFIIENGNRLKSIPYEGSLMILFDSREVLRSLLERTSLDMIHAEVPVHFHADGRDYDFYIKDSPFRLHQTVDGKIVVTGKDKKPVNFTGSFKLLKLDEPQHPSVLLMYNKLTGEYVLPEKIHSWGKTLIVGNIRGRICPALVDAAHYMTVEERIELREETIKNINYMLPTAKIGEELWQRILGWFDRIQKDDIPASSLLELVCVGHDPTALVRLAFQLYVRSSNSEDLETLKRQLISMSDDLAFQWFWIMPTIKGGIANILENFIVGLNAQVMKNIYIIWATSKGEQMMTLLSALSDEEAYVANMLQCITEVFTNFEKWMKELCLASMRPHHFGVNDAFAEKLAKSIIFNSNKLCKIDSKHQYIDANQDYIDEATTNFFLKYDEPNKTYNEQWMYRRVNALATHWKKKIDLFGQSDEVRRSIIYCFNSCYSNFMIAFNNKIY
jgi:hypothetical protein